MVNNKALGLAKYAIMFATIFVAMMLDKAISFVPLGFSMAVCVLLVTLSFCFVENKWSVAVVSGVMFGVASFLKEFILPSPSLGNVFPPQYWLVVTIPPRILMAVVGFAVYKAMLSLCSSVANARVKQTVCLAVATFFALVANTVGFLSALELCRGWYNVEQTGVFVIIYGLLVTNILPEYLVSVICVPLVVLGVRRGLKLGVNASVAK